MELLTVIAVLGVFFTILTATMIRYMDVHSKASKTARLETKMNGVLTQLAAELRSIKPGNAIRNVGNRARYLDVELFRENLEIFSQQVVAGSSSVETYQLYYRLSEDEGSDGFNLVRTYFAVSGGTEGPTSTLIEGRAVGFHVEFRGSGQRWLEEWTSTDTPPKMVKITLSCISPAYPTTLIRRSRVVALPTS